MPIFKLTNIPLLQIRERIQTRAIRRVVKHIRIAQIVNIRACEQLYRSSNDAGDEEHEQDEGQQHHGAREQAALGDEDDFDDEEEYRERADGYAVGHDPVDALVTAWRRVKGGTHQGVPNPI